MHVFWDNSNTVSGRWGLLGELDVAPLCHRLLGGPVSESGRLRHVLTGPQGPAAEGAPAALVARGRSC